MYYTLKEKIEKEKIEIANRIWDWYLHNIDPSKYFEKNHGNMNIALREYRAFKGLDFKGKEKDIVNFLIADTRFIIQKVLKK